MKDVNYHSENLCSIAQIDNTFSGKYIIRDILNRLLRETFIVNAEIQRPYYETQASLRAIRENSSELENLIIYKDWFSLSFTYHTKNTNDRFIETFLEIWFEYEQPAFTFLVSGQTSETQNLVIPKRLHWHKLTNLLTCYVFFKGIEEDVMWIGKSSGLKFDEVIV